MTVRDSYTIISKHITIQSRGLGRRINDLIGMTCSAFFVPFREHFSAMGAVSLVLNRGLAFKEGG